MSHHANADTSALNWVRTGPRNAETILLIHSLGLDLTYWDRQIDVLRATYDIVAFDIPGHGRSPAPPSDWSFDQAAADIAKLIEQVGLDAVHVVGVSLGGMIAQALVLLRPDLVRSLTLISTAASFPESSRTLIKGRSKTALEGGMAATLPGIKQWLSAETMARRPDLVDRITKTLLAGEPTVYATMYTLVSEFDMIGRLHEICCPTLVLVCEDDPSTPPKYSTAMADEVPGAKIVVLPDGAHLAYLEAPAAVNAELAVFLEEIAGKEWFRRQAFKK